MKPLPIYIGYDSNETVAWHVFAHSLYARSSEPLALVPLTRWSLPVGSRDKLASTDFADTRFLVPWLQDYNGWALFADCDMLSRIDIARLFECTDNRYAVMVRKHYHDPPEDEKFLGAKQTRYERKNWSSLILWNCGHPANACMNPELIATMHGLDLHQFKWLNDEYIGTLSVGWNHLVGYEPHNILAPLVHYTLGTPCFHEYAECEYSSEWHKMHLMMNYAKQRNT